MDAIKNYVNKLIFFIGTILLTVLVLTVTWQVVSRYIFNSPSMFTDELSRFLLMWIGMLGATYAFGTKSHLAMDIVHTLIKPSTLKCLRIIIPILAVIFITLVMVIGGSLLTVNTMKQLSPVMQLPMGVVYSILPITGVLNVIYLLGDIKDELSVKVGE